MDGAFDSEKFLFYKRATVYQVGRCRYDRTWDVPNNGNHWSSVPGAWLSSIRNLMPVPWLPCKTASHQSTWIYKVPKNCAIGHKSSYLCRTYQLMCQIRWPWVKTASVHGAQFFLGGGGGRCCMVDPRNFPSPRCTDGCTLSLAHTGA